MMKSKSSEKAAPPVYRLSEAKAGKILTRAGVVRQGVEDIRRELLRLAYLTEWSGSHGDYVAAVKHGGTKVTIGFDIGPGTVNCPRGHLNEMSAAVEHRSRQFPPRKDYNSWVHAAVKAIMDRWEDRAAYDQRVSKGIVHKRAAMKKLRGALHKAGFKGHHYHIDENSNPYRRHQDAAARDFRTTVTDRQHNDILRLNATLDAAGDVDHMQMAIIVQMTITMETDDNIDFAAIHKLVTGRRATLKVAAV